MESLLSIVYGYVSNICLTCDFNERLSWSFVRTLRDAERRGSAGKESSSAQELKNIFMVPRLKKFHEIQNRIKKYELVEAFISFLIRLLSDKTDSIVDPWKDRIGYLEKDLRFLLTVLGDISVMGCADEHEEFRNFMAEFEAVANEAGLLVHSLFFSTDDIRACGKMDEGISVVLEHIDLFKASIMKLLNLLSSIRGSACTAPQTSAVDSLNVDSRIHDLKDSMEPDDNRIASVKDQIGILHQELVFLRSYLLSAIRGSADTVQQTSAVDSLRVIDSLIHDLKDPMESNDNMIAFVKNGIKILHQGLVFLRSYRLSPTIGSAYTSPQISPVDSLPVIDSLIHDLEDPMKRDDNRIAFVQDEIEILHQGLAFLLPYLLSPISGSAYTAPQTSAVDSLRVIDSLIHDLKDLMKRDDNRIAFVRDQIKILHEGLVLLQSSLKDIGAPGPLVIEEMKEPLVRIGDMTYEAEYLIISFLVGDVPLWYLINRLTDVNSKIEHFGNELQQITEKYEFGGLEVVRNISSEPLLQEKKKNEVDDVIVGFEDKEIYILDKLGGGTGSLQVISVFGMPGIGKTTLARKLYNHRSVNDRFDKLSWCVVSQTYRRQNILVDILIHIKSDIVKDRILEIEEERLVVEIHKALKGRRYLIVMDDIWDLNVWDDLEGCFPDDENGSRILFTSRNKDVAPPNSIIYALPSLTNVQCWELLEKKVFGNKSCPPELLRVGKRIAAKCFGLPLTVVVIAGVLSTMDKKRSRWEEVERNLASHLFDSRGNSVTQILELSYKHLPYYLQPCFLYFGTLQEEKEIHVRKLIRLWIAEGFVRKEEQRSAENIGEEYLMELIDKSLVIVAKRRSDGGAKACVLHDLWRELCFKKYREENFLKSSDDSSGYSIHVKAVHTQALDRSGSSRHRQHLHFLRDRGLISPLCVRNMRLSRVLRWDFVGKDLIGIGYMVNLRYLIISNLPASIGSLVNLEYLFVNANVRVDLPPALSTMMKLRCIDVGYRATYSKYCISSQTNNLEFLSRFIISEFKDEEMLKCSPRLRKLKCIIEADQYFDLGFFTQLESLNVSFDMVGKQKIRLPSNIKKLTLSGSMLLLEMMSIIGRLEKLEVLKLDFDAFEGEKLYTIDGEFQELRFLKLRMSHLTVWYVLSSGPFPRLQQLVLVNCCNLQEIPWEIGEIPTLQLIELKGRCQKSLVESAKRIQQEQWDVGNEELKVIISQ